MNDDQQIEQRLQAKGLTMAPRITPLDIEKAISSEYYFTAAQGLSGYMLAEGQPVYAYEKSLDLLTLCVLVLVNGFTVTGESACVSAENFDPEVGRQLARNQAVSKIWTLEGYRLKSVLAAAVPPPPG